MKSIAINVKSSKMLRTVKRNAPAVALIGGGVGLGCAVVTSSIAAVKSIRLIDAEEKRLGRKLTFKEKVKLCGKNYLPTMLLVCASGASLAFSGKKYAKNLKEAGLLYAASEAARQSLEENIVKRFGQKKFNDVQDDVAKQYLEEHPVDIDADMITVGTGNVIFKDMLSGRTFRGDKASVDRGWNNANAMLLERGAISYNDAWDCVSPDFDPIGLGDDVGFNAKDRRTGNVSLIRTYYTWIDNGKGDPICLINYRTRPEFGFDRY